jgi:hypothetical protein
MKKILFFTIFITLIILANNLSFAATTSTIAPQSSNTPTPSAGNKSQLDDLKAKIASKVAELKLTEKRGFVATVTEATGTQITVLDLLNNQRFIDIDELTKFSSPSDTSFGISDIKKDYTLGILGIYNKQSQRILAREVNLITVPKFVNGVVSSVNKDEYSLKIFTEEQKEITVDVENVTRTFSYSSDTGLAKSGFSKIIAGANIVLTGYQSKTDKTRITASRIILLPEIPSDPLINIASQALEKGTTIVPSTGSGKKLTPIVK